MDAVARSKTSLITGAHSDETISASFLKFDRLVISSRSKLAERSKRRFVPLAASLLLASVMAGCASSGVLMRLGVRTGAADSVIVGTGTTAIMANTSLAVGQRLIAAAMNRSLLSYQISRPVPVLINAGGRRVFAGSIEKDGGIAIIRDRYGSTLLQTEASGIALRHRAISGNVGRSELHDGGRRTVHYASNGSREVRAGHDVAINPQEILHYDFDGNLVGRSVITLTQSADGTVTAVAIAFEATEIARRNETPNSQPCACNCPTFWYSTCPDDEITNPKGQWVSGGLRKLEREGVPGLTWYCFNQEWAEASNTWRGKEICHKMLATMPSNIERAKAARARAKGSEAR